MVPTVGAFCEIYHGDGTVETALQEDTQVLPSILSSTPSALTLAKSVSQNLRNWDKTIDPLPQQSLSGTNGENSVNIQITKRTKENRMTEENADLLVYLSCPCAFLFIISF